LEKGEFHFPRLKGWKITIESFATMEMLKTLATVFRRFKFERSISKESEVREGFVVKIMECEVKISLRSGG
jgi:benzoate 4-monooxygenase